MKKGVASFISILLFTGVSIADPSQVVDDIMGLDDITVNVSHEIPLKIYLPPDHSADGDPYPVYIFLHGCCGNTYTANIPVIRGRLDELIGNETIDPLIVVWPNVQSPGVLNPDGILENFSNTHQYTDSSRNGDYESIITTDLLNWLKNPSQHAMPYNISLNPKDYAVGGFSMGGEASMRIGARHHNLFVACVSHSGGMAYQFVRNEVPYILNEYPAAPPYEWSPYAGPWSFWWFALSSDWSPNPNGNVPDWGLDFPLDSETGEIMPAIFDDVWIAENDAIELYKPLKSPSGDPGQFEIPIALYFDVRAQDYNKGMTDLFNSELMAEAIQNFTYAVWPSGGHTLQADAVEAGLRFVNEAMDQAATETPEVATRVTDFRLEQNHPNPFSPVTRIGFTLSQGGPVKLSVYDVTGRVVETLWDGYLPAGAQKVAWNATGRANGAYFYAISAFGRAESRRMMLSK